MRRYSAWIVDASLEIVFQRMHSVDRRCTLDVAFECTWRGCSPWVVDASPEIAFQRMHTVDRRCTPDVAFERRSRGCSPWVVDASPDVAFEWIPYVDSSRLARHSVRSDALLGQLHLTQCCVPTQIFFFLMRALFLSAQAHIDPCPLSWARKWKAIRFHCPQCASAYRFVVFLLSAQVHADLYSLMEI